MDRNKNTTTTTTTTNRNKPRTRVTNDDVFKQVCVRHCKRCSSSVYVGSELFKTHPNTNIKNSIIQCKKTRVSKSVGRSVARSRAGAAGSSADTDGVGCTDRQTTCRARTYLRVGLLRSLFPVVASFGSAKEKGRGRRSPTSAT